MSRPLSDLSASKQNSRSGYSSEHQYNDLKTTPRTPTNMATATLPSPTTDKFHTPSDAPSSPTDLNHDFSPRKAFSPVKYRLQDAIHTSNSPPGSPTEPTLRFNEGLTRAIGNLQDEAQSFEESVVRHTLQDEGMSSIQQNTGDNPSTPNIGDDTEFTLSIDEKTVNEDTIGDLSSISAIPTDLTRFANLITSPTQTPRTEVWSPSKQKRNSVIMNTPGTTQRPLHLLASSNHSTSSNEEDDATPRRPRGMSDSPVDLMNFTGQTNVVIPPPGSAPRLARRTPSGRRGFPIKVNPSPHRSQASVDRERATGWSPQKQPTSYFPDQPIAATPASKRHSMFGAPNGLGMDLLDIDLEPMATPRSIPTVTPRELETLRSEMQSRISGLEATLSGKEAEVMALKRAITDAEVRVGKTSEELRTERAARDEMELEKAELERQSREMEDVLREVKQNAFVEEREREKLRRQAEEAERKAEDHEVKILELRASLDTLRSERLRSSPSPHKSSADPSTPGIGTDVDLAVKNATESVARELHALYKSKHERKVADLKLSYEKRWAKQVDQLRSELKSAQDEVIKLQTERDATMSGTIMPLPGQSEALSKMEGQIEELRRWNEESTTGKKVLEAECTGLKSQIDSLRSENDILRRDLEQERIEKGDLVAEVESFLVLKAEEDEMIAARAQAAEQLSRQSPVSPPRSEDGIGIGRPNSATAGASPNRFRSSLNGENPDPPPNAVGLGNTGPSTGRLGGRPRPMSMLQKPTAGKFSGIPGPGSGVKAPLANGGGPARPGMANGYNSRGGIMENITRMGAGR